MVTIKVGLFKILFEKNKKLFKCNNLKWVENRPFKNHEGKFAKALQVNEWIATHGPVWIRRSK